MSTLDTNPRIAWGPALLSSTRSKRIACLCTSEIQTWLCLPKPTGKLFQPTKIAEQVWPYLCGENFELWLA